jgi:G3E family GTPase
MTPNHDGRIPVVVVSGFLGSGKTTLLRAALTGHAHTAVIVNEFGAVCLDHRLLRNCRERIEIIGGGCACCAKRTDLSDTLRQVLDEHERGRADLHGVVIETSGLTDPAPIVFTITNDAMLRHHFDVVRLTVCVDAVNGVAQLAAHPEALKQVLVADELVITKVDLLEPAASVKLVERLMDLNPGAAVFTSRHGVREVHAIERRSVREVKVIERHGGEVPAHGLRMRERWRPANGDMPAAHTDDVQSLLIPAQEPIDWIGFAVWLSMLVQAWGEQVLRVKGLVELDDGTFVSINGVQHIVHEPEHLTAESVPDGSAGIVFITRGLDVQRLRASLEIFQRIPG